MQKVRSFLAISLWNRLKDHIAQEISQWSTLRAGVRWVKPEQLHLTLKFLGDLSPEQLDAIKEACRHEASAHPPIELHPTVTGVFPTPRRPRILWIGLASTPPEALHRLHGGVEASLERLGFKPEDRPFSPHITVGRVKSGKNISALMERFMQHTPPKESFTADSFTLYSSTLTPQGPIYRVVEKFALTG